jgi:hypothetical protein
LLSFVVDALDDHVDDEGDGLAGPTMADDVSETFGRGMERPEMRPRQVRDGDDVGLKRGSQHMAVIAQLMQVVFASRIRRCEIGITIPRQKPRADY